MEIVKKFLEWINIKEKLHINERNKPFFREGEVWWCAIGENVGIEINGNGETFSRPVLVYKILSLKSFLALPLTSQSKDNEWAVKAKVSSSINFVLLNQARTIDQKRLLSKIANLSLIEMVEIRKRFIAFYA